MSTKKISPSKFITNRYDIDNVAEKYGQILKSQDSLGILIDYANIQNPDSISKNKPIKQLNIDSNQCSPIWPYRLWRVCEKSIDPKSKKRKSYN